MTNVSHSITSIGSIQHKCSSNIVSSKLPAQTCPWLGKRNHHALLELVLEARLGIHFTIYYSTRAYGFSSETLWIYGLKDHGSVQWFASLGFGDCCQNSMGLMCLLVHTEIIGPWSWEEFGTNSEDNHLRSSEDYHRRLCVKKLTPQNCWRKAIASVRGSKKLTAAEKFEDGEKT